MKVDHDWQLSADTPVLHYYTTAHQAKTQLDKELMCNIAIKSMAN